MNSKIAISKIKKNGAILVFPHNNRPEPNSLWREFFPKKKLRWEWSEDGDNSVFDLWGIMKRLSENKSVVYSKWYQGRATFFSRDLFASMLSVFRINGNLEHGLSFEAKEILEILEQDSPLSTKEIKSITGLKGKDNAALYNRATKELFKRLLIVGFGEVDDGAFPSLAVGSTKVLFEDLWRESKELDLKTAQKNIDKYLPEKTIFRKFYDKILVELRNQNLTDKNIN